jgi:hypothetical protein
MNTEQRLRDLLDRPFARVLLQGLLMRTLRRNPMGLVATMLVRKAMTGNGRVFGMDLASRRQARMAWLTGLLQRQK